MEKGLDTAQAKERRLHMNTDMTQGAAQATVIAQYISGLGIVIYSMCCVPYLRMKKEECRIRWKCLQEITGFSVLTCVQQSVMNLGILLVQGAVAVAVIFCIIVSAGVWFFARPLMLLFVKAQEADIIAEGVRYLRIEGAFYCGIGSLFLLYGLYRALGKPGMSVVLTIISLGMRVALAYILSGIPTIGVVGIWWAVPIGWVLADATGFVYYFVKREKLPSSHCI